MNGSQMISRQESSFFAIDNFNDLKRALVNTLERYKGWLHGVLGSAKAVKVEPARLRKEIDEHRKDIKHAFARG